ncbi:MAG TPA: nucleotidyltransferase domain-containing protein [bacterium]|jgi:predicted nucleotidyltransferase|nr:nucleotidyltransferase domain-containing protein [bacterium]
MKDQSTIVNKVKIAKKKYESSGFIILGIFGSYARNEENESSDLDILYELSSDFRAKFKGFKAIAEINRIKEELEDHFGMKIDLVDRSTQNSSKPSPILSEAVYV